MLTFRRANIEDMDLFFTWANDPLARNNSYQKKEIAYPDHKEWYTQQISNQDNYFYVFFNETGGAVGQVRINMSNRTEAVISLLVDISYRGKGYAKEMIKKASNNFLLLNKNCQLIAYIFKTNERSYQSFKKAGYNLLKEAIVKDIPSYILYKNEL